MKRKNELKIYLAKLLDFHCSIKKEGNFLLSDSLPISQLLAYYYRKVTDHID